VNKVDDSTVGPVSAIETDLESHSTVPVVTAEDISENNDRTTHFGSEFTLPGEKARVSPCFNIFRNMDTLCALVLQV